MDQPTTQPIRFGLVHGFGPFDPDTLVAQAVQAESLGFDLFSLADHLHTDQPTLEPWTALAFAAAATEQLVVFPNVLGLPYRDPAVTAKMAETFDRLSGGRLVLGLGVGGYDAEFAAFGLAERTPGQKVAALGEAITIIRGLWEQPTASFDGDHYRLRRARIEPKPAHRIPIWIGAYGPRALRITGALADGWIPSLGRLGVDRAVELRATVLAAAAEAGREPDRFTCATNVVVDLDTDSRDESRPGWHRLSGSGDDLVEHLVAVARAGFTVLNIALPNPGHIERFGNEVIPRVRAALGRPHP